MFGKLTKLLRALHGFARLGGTLLVGTMVVASAGYVGEKLLSGPASAPSEQEEAVPGTGSADQRIPASLPPIPPRAPGAMPPRAGGYPSGGGGDSSADPRSSGGSGGGAAAAGAPMNDATTPNPPDNLPSLGSAPAPDHATDARASTATASSASTAAATSTAPTTNYGNSVNSSTSTDTSTAAVTSPGDPVQGTMVWDQGLWDTDSWWP